VCGQDGVRTVFTTPLELLRHLATSPDREATAAACAERPDRSEETFMATLPQPHRPAVHRASPPRLAGPAERLRRRRRRWRRAARADNADPLAAFSAPDSVAVGGAVRFDARPRAMPTATR
jgi:hypothetical protein